ncbi:LOW QUALITY PROTEIN: pre-mRNA-processing factor 17-like [Physella acuta]|uniref:LOW QUALITY PROTEIN: pre-mRNA-processing factor 17-like n=1 Tax=Physella acuta TaxID=109671 RepID=UPI0027DDE9C1|nr:LOW QUALITY PROTEIN: pre-mRNA-processing factor 17-like [Physella acuta]
MAGILRLKDYESSSDEEEGINAHLLPIKNPEISISQSIALVAAPEVVSNEDSSGLRHIDANTKELKYNPKHDELFAPYVGPVNPYKTAQSSQKKNTLCGFVEPAHVNSFQFDNQRKTFTSYGFALDPSVDNGSQPDTFIGDVKLLEENKGKTVFETNSVVEKKKKKRKREVNEDPADIDGYLGPWAKYKDEETVSRPSEEEQKVLDEILAKRNKSGKQVDEKPLEEKTTLHIKDAYDYQNRSFLHPPQDVGVNLKSEEPPEKCFLPKKLIHTWAGHTKGIAAIRWFPKFAHLILSAGMDCKIKIWEVYKERRCIRTYTGHKQAVRDICFNNDGKEFLSCGYDRYCKLWDTETGECKARFTSRKVPYCVKFHPEEDKQHLFVAGTSDKKIVCWDIRSGDIIQEYDRHLGPVNTITFIDQNRRFVSTSDDKSLRVWEWDVPVDFKYIADPSMHSMPAVTLSPNGKWLACQSMDNKICVFNALNRMKFIRKKTFTGHMVAGYACGIDFSPEMSYITCGDADGKVYIWDWRSTKLYSKFKAHDDVCINVLWHPHETSKLATAGWDGVIKYWD